MLKSQLVLKLSNMRAYFEQPILRSLQKEKAASAENNHSSGGIQAELQKQSV